jgi:hypothetical protein
MSIALSSMAGKGERMPRVMRGIMQDRRLGEADKEDQRQPEGERGRAGGKAPRDKLRGLQF